MQGTFTLSSITIFMNKNNLCKNNEAQVKSKIKNNLRTDPAYELYS